ncbi:hypothetical protein C1645_838969 [Glomus cerebriforme]|uniref:MACPF domain-containing protein n=1 Tax=Glomus cerebriforme TaxID=658196 RepID=A0A397SD23_9GLOM|nr:hypothetical protein C1645_838969 [Glomus cerebriforme]
MSSVVGVQIGEKYALVRLNLEDNLAKVRTELEKHTIVRMNNTLSFAARKDRTVIESYEIAHENEVEFHLNDIIDIINAGGKKEYILHLIESSKPIWNFFNDKCKLDYGRTMTNNGIKEAENRAFIMEDCELIESNKLGAIGCRCGKVEFNSNEVEDWIMKRNLFFAADDKVRNFVKLGLSVGTLRNENFRSETNLSYHYTNYGKLVLKFNKCLKPTTEFINEVNDVIKSKNPRNFKRIIEKFGQFIPTEVILGGRVCSKDCGNITEYSTENVTEVAMGLGILNITETGIASNSGHKIENSKFCKFNNKILIGGEQPENFNNFDDAAEKAWVKSLENYKNWDCIEFKNPISIFKLLDDDLYKQILSLVGKKILYSKTEYVDYYWSDKNKPNFFELCMPPNILKILDNEEADCNIYATVIHTEESTNGSFVCQIFFPPHGKPRLIIHCVQTKVQEFKKKFKSNFKLKINWMVIGYDIDFNSIPFDNDVQLKVIKNDFSAQNNQTVQESNSFLRFGIPVLNELDVSNNYPIIGHHFFNIHENNMISNKIGLRTFSYCLKNNYCINLPNFTFYTLVISNFSPEFSIISFDDFNKNTYSTRSNINGYPQRPQ